VLTGDGGLLLGRGDGTFASPQPMNLQWVDGERIDYNDDGRIDVIVGTGLQTLVLLSRSQPAPNQPPVADAGADRSIRYESQFEQEEPDIQDAGSYDPNLDPLTFEWRDENGSIISTERAFNWPPRTAGTYAYTLTVRDNQGTASSDPFTYTVLPYKESVTHAEGERHGAWRLELDPSAAADVRVWHPNANAPKITTAAASPDHYVDHFFIADPSQTYKIWVRLRAEDDHWTNDSIFVQFEAATVNGQSRYGIGTTDALDINLEQCSGCGVSGWGWRDERWGAALGGAPVLLRFPKGGWQRMRIQTREDGVSVDQVVLSAEQYLNAAPGPAKNDNTKLQWR
jgi:hypothetical protein